MRLIRDGGKGVLRWGKSRGEYIYTYRYTVTTRMTPALRWAAMGTPNSVIQPLQKIQNFAARLVLLASRHHHATPLLEKLHWLPISECIKYKVA